MKRTSVVAAVVLLGAIAVIVGRSRGTPDLPGRSASGPARAAAARVAAPHVRPLPSGTFDVTRRELEQRAIAGDAEAAYRLGSVIAQCRTFVAIDDGAFAHALASASGLLRRLMDSDADRDERLMLDSLIENKAQLDSVCSGTDSMRRTARPGDAARWLGEASALGETHAMALYPDVAFDEFPTAADLVDHAAEVASRRDRARQWLRAALDAGEPEALVAMAKAYVRGDLYPKDPERALAWWLAYRRYGGEGELGPAMTAVIDRRLRADVDADGATRAEGFARSFVLRRRARAP